MLSLNSYVNFYSIKKAFRDLMFIDNTKEILEDSLYRFLKDYNKNSIFNNDILLDLVKDTIDMYLKDQDIQFNYDKEFLKEEIELTFESSVLDYIPEKKWEKCLKSKNKSEIV